MICRYNKDKGFFCIKVQNGKSDCLGKSKGRRKSYGKIDSMTEHYLRKIFSVPNRYLKDYLNTIDWPIPTWLEHTI